MKKVYLDIAGRMHSLYRELLEYPPDGYEFVIGTSLWDRSSRAASNTDFIYFFQKNFLKKVVPVSLIKPYLERWKRIPQGTDLTYSAGHLIFRKEPWVVDLEMVTELTGYDIRYLKRYKRLVERILASHYCKRIICWTEAGKNTVLWNLDCERFREKIEVVPLAVRKKDFVKSYGNSKIKLLFVNSPHILGQFAIKGGREVLEAFIHLNRKYDNLELVIRSDMPAEAKNKYSQIGNTKIIDEIIPWGQLEQEFKSADIFLLPAHSWQDVAVLDAMSYELPVITTDVWANPEWVEDGATGFVIKKSDKLSYYIETLNLSPSLFRRFEAYKAADPRMVEELVAKTSILIENPDLRKRMGKVGRKEIETGKFSIEKRNEKLKRIFDEATVKGER